MRSSLTATLLGLVAALAGPAAPSRAALLTYSASFTGSGTLGATSFTNATITVSGEGDTSTVRSPEPRFYDIDLINPRITVAGIGTFSATSQLSIGLVQYYYTMGFFADGFNFLGIANPAFRQYDFTTPIGPVAIEPTSVAGGNSPYPGRPATTAGRLTLTSVTSSATFSAVPEPSSLALCGLAVGIGLAGACARRRHGAAWS